MIRRPPRYTRTDTLFPYTTRFRSGGEEHPGRLREDQPLDDDSHVDRAVIEAVVQAVGDGPVGEQRRAAAPDVLQDRIGTDHVEERVLLAREGCAGQVLRGGARAHRPRRVRSEARRVGKGCVRTARSWRAPYHSKKKNALYIHEPQTIRLNHLVYNSTTAVSIR